MRCLRNQEGVALVMALMFTLISLGMIMMLLTYVLTGTKMSAAQVTYKSSLAASYGAADLVTKTIIPRLFDNYTTGKRSLLNDFSPTDRLSLSFPNQDLLQLKITKGTAEWGTGIARRSVDPKSRPDFVFKLNGPTGTGDFTVYSKIVDTVPGVGLIDASGVDFLDAGMGVAGSGSSTQTPRTPTIYSIEVQGEKTVNPKEKAGLSVLYAY